MTAPRRVLHLGTVTTGSGRPFSSPEVQADLARLLLSIPTPTQPAREARDEQPNASRVG